ncbi:T9SS type A sorting domain-containing protein [uncultured Flavobacterium sp.]|uniref:T9SS type A sorting domain-containing protein n=1 Tax=uncultured Flavobacterium sp. TaxID=165435 RepID=UPI0030CA2990
MKTKLHLLLIAIFFSFNSFAQFTPVTITGSGVGGWNMPGSIVMETTDGITYTKVGMQLKGDFNLKFAINNAWGTTGGSLTGGWPSGTASLVGTGANIVGAAGFWNVTIDITTGVYAFTQGVNPNRNVNFSGAGLSSDVSLTSTNNLDYSKESVTFVTGGNGSFIEMTSPINPSPTANWSSVGFPSGTGTQGGAPIPVVPGTYYMFLNANTGAYDFLDTTVSIVGGFNDWSNTNSVDLTSTDNINYTLLSYTFTSSTGLKFMDNHSWNINMGSTTNPSGFPTGIATQTGPTDIAVPAGTYNITFNRTTLAYEFISLNAAVNYVGTTSTPSTKALSTADGTNYSGQEITFSGTGSGDFNEIASVLNTGSSFFTWPAVASPVAGFWNVMLNITTGVNSFVPTVVSVIGGFNPENWSDVEMTSADGVTYTSGNLVVTGARNNFKFRDNHDWTFQFGHAVALADGEFSPLTGTLTGTDTKDMWLTTGTYSFTFNRVTLAYTITVVDLAANKFDINKFSVYPNPTKNAWNFASGNSDISSVKIIDMLGRSVMSKNATSKEVSVDASSLSKGMYFAKITSGDSVQTLKVIKN